VAQRTYLRALADCVRAEQVSLGLALTPILGRAPLLAGAVLRSTSRPRLQEQPRRLYKSAMFKVARHQASATALADDVSEVWNTGFDDCVHVRGLASGSFIIRILDALHAFQHQSCLILGNYL
jgi:hypothetical protein